jgi:hypothetical protein
MKIGVHSERNTQPLSSLGLPLGILIVALLAALLLPGLAHAGNKGPIPVYTIVIPADADASVQSSARLLSQYILLATGTEIPIKNESAVIARNITRIHLGNTTYVKTLPLGLEKLDPDGFVITFPDATNMVMAGASDSGTEFAVYEFVERYLGVRWLFPGDLGEYIPPPKALQIPTDEVRQEPAFFHRELSGSLLSAATGQQPIWARRNRMNGRMSFTHHLYDIFPPESYTATHPEFFPVIGGSRYLPAAGVYTGWQPCFSATGLVAEAVKNISAYFDAHPDVTSYSLGVNDSGGYCQCSLCQARLIGGKNFMGYVDYSNIYYDWCNKVVAGVTNKYPNKYFGCLAYSNVGSAPTAPAKLDSHLIPYMTYERFKWVDKAREQEGHQVTAAWANTASVLGWYDYVYGMPELHFIVPRIWFHKMADYLRFGYEHNVRACYAEAYPAADWKEGPKLYLALKLLWNPYLDVDQTLNEWYVCAVGSDAAPYLAAYFSFWEDYWTTRVPQTQWFKDGGRVEYLNDFTSPYYLLPLTQGDINKCEQLLKLVLEKAKTQDEKARANLFLSSFETTKKGLLPVISAWDFATSAKPPVKKRVPLYSDAFNSSSDMTNTWSWCRDPSGSTIYYDPAVGNTNAGSVAINVTKPDPGACVGAYSIPIQDANKTYRFAAYYRSQNLDEGALIECRLHFQNTWNGAYIDDYIGITQKSKAGVINKSGWQLFEVYFKYPWNASQKAFYVEPMIVLDKTSKGTVWFDDISLSEVEF